jgi:RimJ/RimL family protein N-acetyltransferase
MDVELVEYDRIFLEKSFYWLTDPYIQHTTDTPSLTKEKQLNWFDSLPNQKDCIIWGISYQGMPVGACGLKHIQHHTAECWWYIGERGLHGRGIGSTMADLVIKKAENLGLDSMWCKVLLDNIISYNLFVKKGFVLYDKDARFFYLKKKLNLVIKVNKLGGGKI